MDEGYRGRHSQFRERVEAVARKAGKGADLTLAEAEKSLEALFPLHDRQLLGQIMRQHHQQSAIWYKTKGKELISSADFINIVMKYKLRQYEESIEGFRNAFEACDSDKDGRLFPAEFLHLLSLMTPAPDPLSSQSYLRTLDPANHQVLPFSLCLSFLSMQPGGLLGRFQRKLS